MTHRLGFLAVLALVVGLGAACGSDTLKVQGGESDGFTFGGSCEDKECGTDGCFGVCGFCPCPTCSPDKTECSPEGKCIVKSTKMGCYGLLDCLNLCASDANCQTECFNQTSPAGQQKYQDLVDCIIAECTSFPTDECIQNSLMGICLTVYMDCINDM